MRGIFACFVLAIYYSLPASAESIAEFDGGLIHDSNLNNAERGLRSDTALTASLVGGQFFQLNRDLSVVVTAGLRSETYQHFSGMTHVSASANGVIRHKFGLGTAAPWARLSASAARLEFDDDVRDGWVHRVGITLGKRLAQRWDLEAQYGFERRRGDNERAAVRGLSGDVFDLKSQTFALDLRYSLSDRALVFAGYSWRNGEVVSSSTPNAKIFRSSAAITRDPVFGPNNFAYKLDAVSRAMSMGVSQALTSRSALSFTYQRQVTHAEGDNDYFKNVFAVSYSHIFF